MKNSKFDKNSMKQLFKEIKTVWELNHTLNVFVVRTELKEMKPGIKNHFNDDDLNFIPLTKVCPMNISCGYCQKYLCFSFCYHSHLSHKEIE